LESGEPLSPPLVRALCDRHRGVGGDGVLEPVAPREGAEFGLRIHNPDGSEAEKSGNGLRIFAHWLVSQRGAEADFRVWTPGGLVRCHVAGTDVTVEMGSFRAWGPEVLAGEEAWRVDVGNPHAVIFGWPEDWRARGAAVEQSVPGRTNVQFVEVRGGVAYARIWERGAGETLSSGSSACAVAVAGVRRGLLTSPVEVRMAGGALAIEVGEALTMRGPVEGVGRIVVQPGWVERRRYEGAEPNHPGAAQGPSSG
jgi:diaminopimelate epimerase